MQTGSEAHPAAYWVDADRTAPAREADRSPARSAEVKNEWSYTSILPYAYHGVQRENFIFYV